MKFNEDRKKLYVKISKGWFKIVHSEYQDFRYLIIDSNTYNTYEHIEEKFLCFEFCDKGSFIK